MNSILSSQMPKFSITNEKNSAQKYPSDLKYSKIKINFTFPIFLLYFKRLHVETKKEFILRNISYMKIFNQDILRNTLGKISDD
jgi:hypothetical protein